MSKEQKIDPTSPAVYSAIDRILDGKEAGLLGSILADFTPSEEGKKPSGISARSIFRAIGFAIRRPLDTVTLIRFARSGGYTSPEFQNKLLNSDKLWDALDKEAPGKIPQFAKIAASFMSDAPLPSVPVEVQSDPLAPSPYAAAIENLRGNPRLRQLLANNKESLQTAVESLQNKYPVKGYLEQFGVKPEAFKLVPWALTHVDETLTMLDAFVVKDADGKKRPFMNTVGTILNIVAQDKELSQFFKDNPDMVPALSDAYLNQYPEWSDSMGLRSGILRLVVPLLENPELARNVIMAYNSKDFMKLADLIVTELSNPGSKLLEAMQTEAGKKVFVRLFQDIIANNPSLKTTLEQYGVREKDIPNVAKIFEILLKTPVDLQNTFSYAKKGDYVGMIKEILIISNRNPKIKEYLEANKELVGRVAGGVVAEKLSPISPTFALNTVSATTEQFAKYVVDYIKQPEQIINAIEGYKKGGVAGIAVASVAAARVVKDVTVDAASHLASATTKAVGGAASVVASATASAVSSAASGIVSATRGATSYLPWSKTEAQKQADNLSDEKPIAGGMFKGVTISGASKNKRILNVNITDSTFEAANISYSSFKSAKFKGVDFRAAQLIEVSFSGSVLNGVDFTGAKLEGVSFMGAKPDAPTLRSILDPKTNRKNTKLSGIEIPAGILKEASKYATAENPIDLTGATIVGSEADIKDINITYVRGGKIKYLSAKPPIASVSPNASFAEPPTVPSSPNASFAEGDAELLATVDLVKSVQKEAAKIGAGVNGMITSSTSDAKTTPPGTKPKDPRSRLI
ncbi:MAG: pentapeptide repeat-containing protein [Pseudomonadota bacterium]